MIILSTSSDLIQVITASSVQLDVQASYMDLSTANAITPGRLNNTISTNTTRTVVAGPSSGTRTVKHLSVANTHASSSNVTTVQHYDGTTTVTLIKVTLLAGYTLVYDDAGGWIMTDPAGTRIQTSLPGRFIGSTLLTAASSTFTVSPYTNKIKVKGVGGGGGGGGCTNGGATTAGAGGGGGAGGYAEVTFTVTPKTAYTYTCGALGPGGISLIGTAGGNSTFIVGGTTVTAFGGSGGGVGTAVATASAYAGGAGGVVSTFGDVNGGGECGENGIIIVRATTSTGTSGSGGSGFFGKGGLSINAAGTGNTATGFGAGGGGAFTNSSAARTGGAGVAGCWIVEEYT